MESNFDIRDASQRKEARKRFEKRANKATTWLWIGLAIVAYSTIESFITTVETESIKSYEEGLRDGAERRK